MKVLVTGRRGQVARSLAEWAQGHPGIDLFFAGRPEIDLEQPGSLARVIGAHRPDVVVNAAAYTAVDQAEDEPELAQRINADAAGEAAGAAREAGAAIIQISTDYVFDGTAREPYRETDSVRPIGVYGRTKLLGEEQVRAANPRHVVLRTAWVYSPFGRNFVKSIIDMAQTRDRLTVVDDQQGSPTSALDLANAILMLIEHWREGKKTGLGQTYHVAGSGVASWCGLASAVMAECRQLGFPAVEVEPIRTENWPTRAARPAFSALDSGKFAAEVGFTMPPWQQSVRETVRRLAEVTA